MLNNALVRVVSKRHTGKWSNSFLNLWQVQVNTSGWSFSWACLGAVTAEDLSWFFTFSPRLVKKSSIHVDHIGSHVIRYNKRLVLKLGKLLDPLQHCCRMSTLGGGTECVWSTHCEQSFQVEGSRHRTGIPGLVTRAWPITIPVTGNPQSASETASTPA